MLNKVWVLIAEYDGDVELVGASDDEEYCERAKDRLKELEPHKYIYVDCCDFMRIQGI